ncbi:MAG: hypothetical protein QME21_18965 [Anaerolineales bacterium]|nr:hypothetical protein [Anaerolineales bacterium]
MNRFRQLFKKKPTASKPTTGELLRCVACGRGAMTSRQWYDYYEAQGYFVNRVSGQAIYEGELYELDPLSQHFDAAAAQAQQHSMERVAVTRGYQCRACGRVFCLVCVLQAPRPAEKWIVAACPACGGILHTLEIKPDVEVPGRLYEDCNWSELTARWITSTEEPTPALWLLWANGDMAQMLVERRPRDSQALLSQPPQVIEFLDGSAAVMFTLQRGEDILKLVDLLLRGQYSEPLVTLGGATTRLPSMDENNFVQRFKPDECIKISPDSLLWSAWSFFAVEI